MTNNCYKIDTKCPKRIKTNYYQNYNKFKINFNKPPVNVIKL